MKMPARLSRVFGRWPRIKRFLQAPLDCNRTGRQVSELTSFSTTRTHPKVFLPTEILLISSPEGISIASVGTSDLEWPEVRLIEILEPQKRPFGDAVCVT